MYTDRQNNKELDQSLKKAKTFTGWDNLKKWVPSIIILSIATFWVLNRG